MASSCTCSTSPHRPSCSLYHAAASGGQDAEAGAQAGSALSDNENPHLGTVARRALFASKNRWGSGSRRKSRNKDARSLRSRLSKMTVADEVEE